MKRKSGFILSCDTYFKCHHITPGDFIVEYVPQFDCSSLSFKPDGRGTTSIPLAMAKTRGPLEVLMDVMTTDTMDLAQYLVRLRANSHLTLFCSSAFLCFITGRKEVSKSTAASYFAELSQHIKPTPVSERERPRPGEEAESEEKKFQQWWADYTRGRMEPIEPSKCTAKFMWHSIRSIK